MASKKILGLTIQIGAETSKVSEALKQIQNESKLLESQLKTVEKQLKFDPSNTELLAQKMNILEKEADLAERKMSVFSEAEKAANKAAKEGAVTTKQAADATKDFQQKSKLTGEELKRTKVDIDNAKKSTGEMNTSLKTTATTMTEAGKAGLSLGQLIKGNLISTAITSGLKTVGDLVKNIATGLLDAGKNAAKFAIEFGKSSITAAADLKETIGTTERLFSEESAQSLKAWADYGAQTMGLSRNSALSGANAIGNLLLAKGIEDDEAAYMTMTMMQRAADIGANFNMSTEDVVGYLTSMLKGNVNSADAIGIVTNAEAVNARAQQVMIRGHEDEIIGYAKASEEYEKAQEELNEAIKKFGAQSDEATKANDKLKEKSKALSAVLKDYTKEVTAAEKATALWEIGMEQTVWMSGTFEEESEGLSGQMQKIQAQLENYKADIGTALLPVAETVLGKLSGYVSSSDGKEFIDAISDYLSRAADSIIKWINGGGLSDLEKKVKGVVDDITEWFSNPENQAKIKDFFEVSLPKAVGVAETAVDLLIKTFEVAAKIIDTVKTGIEAAVNAIKAADEFIRAHANGGDGELSWGDSNIYAETQMAYNDMNLFSDGWGNYDFSALDNGTNDVKKKGGDLVKETKKVGVDEAKAVLAAVEATNAAAGRFASIDISGLGSLVVRMRGYVEELTALSAQVNGIEINGKVGATVSVSSSSTPQSINQSVNSALQSMINKVTGKHASGGVNLSGIPSIVGEAGYEAFIPAVDGNVLSHWDTTQLVHNAVTNNNNSGGNVTLYQTVNVSGSAGAGTKVANDFIDACRRKGINPTKL